MSNTDFVHDETVDMAEVLARRGALGQATPPGNKSVCDVYVIASLAGCGKQPPHGDTGDEGDFEAHRAVA